MSDNSDGLNEAFLREKLERDRENNEAAPHPILGEIDDPVARSAVAKIITAYDEGIADDYRDFEETPLYRLIKSHGSGMAMARDVEEGNLSRISYRKGAPSSSVETYGMDALMSEMMQPAHSMLVIGAKGSGKTDFVERVISELYGNGLDVWQNVPVNHSDSEFGETLSSLLEFAKQPGDRVAVVDEFSTKGTGYAGSGAIDVEQALQKTINAFRKNPDGSTRTIWIGHRGHADVHPIVRENVQLVVKKAGKGSKKKRAIVYRSDERNSAWEQYEDDNKWFVLKDIPQSPRRWRADTDYFANFVWDLDDPAKQIQRGQLIDGWEAFQEDADGSENDSSPIHDRCQGEKENGNRCGITDPSRLGPNGYCQYHRDQHDPDGGE
ncbi:MULTISPECIES: hypothetical protein [unclassified Haloarcula]|uniref:hypothetical protein n=1 Tax=unclassified Haloarcula TaxID=2624677 RepID=UPI000EF24264|nr:MULTISPECIES: hypothetical protein [unclassified Haloarcula]RLM37215.1 hypothetical protein DVK01_11490 [Haloarcula sp. Atlit-120R]RLM44395.1 hypothetical protein DVK00_07970 [Haloarcula sp. Atlit-47R]